MVRTWYKSLISQMLCITELVDLIRITVVERYGLYSRAQRRKAVEEMAALRLPVGSWQEMENESLNGGADA